MTKTGGNMIAVRCHKCGKPLATVVKGAEAACHECKVWTKAK